MAVIGQYTDGVQPFQHGARVLDDLLAQRRDADMPRLPGEHLETQRGFQLSDGLAGTGLGDAHALSSARDVAHLGHDHQQAPVQEVHHDFQ